MLQLKYFFVSLQAFPGFFGHFFSELHQQYVTKIHGKDAGVIKCVKRVFHLDIIGNAVIPGCDIGIGYQEYACPVFSGKVGDPEFISLNIGKRGDDQKIIRCHVHYLLLHSQAFFKYGSGLYAEKGEVIAQILDYDPVAADTEQINVSAPAMSDASFSMSLRSISWVKTLMSFSDLLEILADQIIVYLFRHGKRNAVRSPDIAEFRSYLIAYLEKAAATYMLGKTDHHGTAHMGMACKFLARHGRYLTVIINYIFCDFLLAGRKLSSLSIILSYNLSDINVLLQMVISIIDQYRRSGRSF